MKNYIVIDIDTDREPNILFGKDPEQPKPTNRTEAEKMILIDITHISGALCTLIDTADFNNYASKEFLIKSVKEQLDTLITDNTQDIFRD